MIVFRLPLRAEPWSSGPHESRPCPVCGKGWVPWAGSLLPCHGRCLLAEAAQDALLESPEPERQMAARLGVTMSVVRASIGAARRRRKELRS